MGSREVGKMGGWEAGKECLQKVRIVCFHRNANL